MTGNEVFGTAVSCLGSAGYGFKRSDTMLGYCALACLAIAVEGRSGTERGWENAGKELARRQLVWVRNRLPWSAGGGGEGEDMWCYPVPAEAAVASAARLRPTRDVRQCRRRRRSARVTLQQGRSVSVPRAL